MRIERRKDGGRGGVGPSGEGRREKYRDACLLVIDVGVHYKKHESRVQIELEVERDEGTA